MSNEELKVLLEKYLSDEITPAERQRLQVLVQNDHNRHTLGEMIAAILAEERYTTTSQVDLQQAFGEVMQEAAHREARSRERSMMVVTDSSSSPYFRIFYKLAAAAILLVGLGTGAYWWYRSPQPVANRPVAAVVVPGGNKAILTLADGSIIELDSAREGALGNQGGTRIIKLNGGRLAYAANSAANAGAGSQYNTISTPRGGQYQVVLPDGSQVWLNAASSLRFPVAFTGKDRAVTLTGEAYFEVAQNAGQPFIVQTTGMQVKVLGTHFNVMAYSDEGRVKTTLMEGAVSVSQGKATSLMQPGQQASINESGEAFNITRPDLEEVMAWKTGEFRFRKTDIRMIMRQIARWYNVEIEYKGDLSGITLYGGMTRKENVAQLLELLEQTGEVHFSTNGNHITVMPAGMN
ncbi:FecR domain-containing protein [Chitinophaga sp. 22321]|uniref:FecR domain-containing protein n=1 Tax=Chitinophaga hostae TaxID=2831022 RepID=A0ABS5J793_9BACT|nr:FecR family protein [Chitinophaga hostae]MBS0031087.1 FecR domain-containing protein [Chitinophaga hostae]